MRGRTPVTAAYAAQYARLTELRGHSEANLFDASRLSLAMAHRPELRSAERYTHEVPVELGVWRIGSRPERIEFQRLDLEGRLEELLAQDLSLLAPNLLLIGRQVRTEYGKLIDLLAMDSDGSLVVAELKRHSTPRDVVAQVLDYGSWVVSLGYEDVVRIYAEKHPGKAFEAAFGEVFGEGPPEEINRSHSLYVWHPNSILAPNESSPTFRSRLASRSMRSSSAISAMPGASSLPVPGW